MESTKSFGKRSIHSLVVASTILATVFLGNVSISHAASGTDASPAATTVTKTERVVSDSWITTKVKSEILANSLSKAFKVRVKTKFGVVKLGGKLPSQDAIDLVKMTAEKVAWSVKSVG